MPYLNRSTTIRKDFYIESILEEFAKSAVPRSLAIENVTWLDGDDAIAVLTETAIDQVQRVSSYVTRPAAQILQNYQCAADGGWFAWGTTLEGDRGAVAYAKLANPRKFFDKGKLKTIKYETPLRSKALPLLPCVDWETARQIFDRYNVEPVENETFWKTVQRCNLPVAITEGLKKALSLIAHGLPAIAVRGIGCWHKKGAARLHDLISLFATPKREIYIVFDQDEKPKTQQDVARQIQKLGTALGENCCKVSVLTWDRALGKGIDDVLFGRGKEAQIWFDDAIANAPPLHRWKIDKYIAQILDQIQQLNSLTYPVERSTEGGFFPDLPDLTLGAVHVVTATMAAGKTTAIRKQVQQSIANGMNVLFLTPVNALGMQSASEMRLPHIHDLGITPDEQIALWSMAKVSQGVVMCPDSLHRIPDWFWRRPILLVMDEANQILDHIVRGDTLGNRYADIVQRFTSAAKCAISTGAIILAEDGIPDRAVRCVQELTGAETVKVFQHRRCDPWNCEVLSGSISGYRARLLEAVSLGDRLLYVTSSQREGKRLERAILKQFPDRRVIRIDGETNENRQFDEFFTQPDQWLQQALPDILIVSPSAKSGVSIEGGVSREKAYFRSVWGFFPALDTTTHAQLLGRYRPSVPRYIWAPSFILGDRDESLLNPRAIRRRLNKNAAAFATIYQIYRLLEADDCSEDYRAIETALLDYLGEARAVSGLEKSIAQEALIERLVKAGHCVKTNKIKKQAGAVALWGEVQEEIWREDARAIATTKIEPYHTTEWAHKILDSLESSREVRRTAHKVLWRNEFPGVGFDDFEECYEALCVDYGAMRYGVRLQAAVENLPATLAGDRLEVEAVLNSSVRPLHRLPRLYAKAWLLHQTGVLTLLEGDYSNYDKRAIAVKNNALRYSAEIRYWLRLQIKDTQTPVEIANKLLRKFKLSSELTVRPGGRGKQFRVYRVTGQENPIRQRLLNAARERLRSVAAIGNQSDQSKSIAATSFPEQLPYLSDLPPDWVSDILAAWESATTPEEFQVISAWVTECRGAIAKR